MGRGVIEAELFRAEQYQLEQRTADPNNPEPNEEWLRVDIKPTYQDADGVSQTGVAEYRRANTSGAIETAPVAALGDSTNADVIDKIRAYVDAGGSPTGTGFIPHATGGAAYPHKRLQHPTDGQVALHDSLTANAIPDSAVHRWALSAGSGSTATDGIGSADGSIFGASWVSGTWVRDNALDFTATTDNVATGGLGNFGSNLGGSWALALTVQYGSQSNQRIFVGGDDADTQTRFTLRNGDFFNSPADSLNIDIQNENSNNISVATDSTFADGNKHRVVVNGDGTDASNIQIAVDGSFVPVSSYANGTISNSYQNLTQSGIGSYRSTDAVVSTMDDYILFNSHLSSTQVQDDYNRQPWS